VSIDKQRVRADLLAAADYTHLNSAGASLMPRNVLEAQLEYLQLEARVGGYEAERQRQADLDAVYDSVARLLDCRPSEIALVENATVGWMMAFYAIPFAAGDRILTVEAEYASNYLAYLQIARENGVIVDTIPSTADGEACVESLRDMIDERVRLISVTHVPTNGGLVNPIEEIGAIAREQGILYLVDACQSAGQIPLNVERIGCDLLSATGRKFLRGPRGSGFLYVSERILDQLHPPMIDLHSAEWVEVDRYRLRADARRFENWENNYAARLGLGRAIDYALEIGLDNIAAEVVRLADRLRERLAEIPGVTVFDIGRRRCGIVTFAVNGVTAAEVESRLRDNRIHVSVTSPSGTLIDATRRQLPDMVRASVHYFNEDAEIELCAKLVGKIAAT
jgi:selenocysteine lyase/cysteine desulfurase